MPRARRGDDLHAGPPVGRVAPHASWVTSRRNGTSSLEGSSPCVRGPLGHLRGGRDDRDVVPKHPDRRKQHAADHRGGSASRAEVNPGKLLGRSGDGATWTLHLSAAEPLPRGGRRSCAAHKAAFPGRLLPVHNAESPAWRRSPRRATRWLGCASRQLGDLAPEGHLVVGGQYGVELLGRAATGPDGSRDGAGRPGVADAAHRGELALVAASHE